MFALALFSFAICRLEKLLLWKTGEEKRGKVHKKAGGNICVSEPPPTEAAAASRGSFCPCALPGTTNGRLGWFNCTLQEEIANIQKMRGVFRFNI